MCKPKNRIMCPDCGRQKMLFESESKASNFIKFNKDNIENGEQLRAYYCPACCDWHISHQRYHQGMEGRTDKLIESYNILKSKVKFPRIDEIIDEVYQILVIKNCKTIKDINKTLNSKEYSNYSNFIKQEAKVKYCIENNINKNK